MNMVNTKELSLSRHCLLLSKVNDVAHERYEILEYIIFVLSC